ncbi:MAG: hypothetical protein ACQERB_16555 [Promethearchaeati archaeon]
MIWYITFIDLMILVLAIVNVYFSIKNWKESKISINSFIMIFLTFLLFTAFRQVLFGTGVIEDVYIGENLSLNGIFSLIMILSIFQFLLYLKEWRRFYFLPIIFAFYSIYYLIFLPENLLYQLSSIIIGALSFFVITIDGIRSKNGVAFSIAFIFIYGLVYSETLMIIPAPFYAALFRLIGIFGVFLGMTGFLDKYILVSEDKTKIKNTWIAKMVD